METNFIKLNFVENDIIDEGFNHTKTFPLWKFNNNINQTQILMCETEKIVTTKINGIKQILICQIMEANSRKSNESVKSVKWVHKEVIYFQNLLQEVINELQKSSLSGIQEKTQFSTRVFLNLSNSLYIWIA